MPRVAGFVSFEVGPVEREAAPLMHMKDEYARNHAPIQPDTAMAIDHKKFEIS
jgi:hypothetical protein